MISLPWSYVGPFICAQSALFALMLQELPACAAMESLCQTCVQRVLSGRRSGVAHHDETLALEDVVYLLYLVMGHLKGHSLRCSYASEDMSAWPTADWQAVTINTNDKSTADS